MEKRKCLRCVCIFSLVVLYLTGILFIGGGAYMLYTEYNTVGPGCNFSTIQTYARRGMTSVSQENTLLAHLNAITSSYGTEVDIKRTTDNVFVAFNDDNAFETTGENMVVSENSYQDKVQYLKYKNTINGYNYADRSPLALFRDIVNQACAINNEAPLKVNIKGELDETYSRQILEIMDASPCSCNSNQRLIFETAHFQGIPTFRHEMSRARCNKAKMSLVVSPKTYALGEYFWLRTKYMIYIGKPDIVNAHYKFHWEHSFIFRELKVSGFCVGIHGNLQNELTKFPTVDFRVVDTSSATYRDVEYQPNVHTYGAMFFFWGLGFFVVFAITGYVGYLFVREFRKRRDGILPVSGQEN